MATFAISAPQAPRYTLCCDGGEYWLMENGVRTSAHGGEVDMKAIVTAMNERRAQLAKLPNVVLTNAAPTISLN